MGGRSRLLLAMILAGPATVYAQESTTPVPERAFDPKGSDPAAVALVDRMWTALGGRKAYDSIDYICFTSSRLDAEVTLSSHTLCWDRRQDRVRLEMRTNRGELVVLLRLREGKGSAFENDEPVPEADQGGVVQHARRLCEDDLYWLLMPWRLKDPGVHLRVAGEIERGGRKLARVQVTMDPGGWLDPEKLFHVALDPEDGRLVEWSWPRPEAGGGTSEVVFAWADWVERSGVQFCSRQQEFDGSIQVVHEPIETPETLVPDTFGEP